MKIPPPSGVFDGHSVAFVGYHSSKAFPGGGYFIFRNSWGDGLRRQGLRLHVVRRFERLL